jgi:hypothetical protein
VALWPEGSMSTGQLSRIINKFKHKSEKPPRKIETLSTPEQTSLKSENSSLEPVVERMLDVDSILQEDDFEEADSAPLDLQWLENRLMENIAARKHAKQSSHLNKLSLPSSQDNLEKENFSSIDLL